MQLTESYIETIDAHTMGEAARIIVGGLPPIAGHTMMEKKLYMQSENDRIRKFLMHEPRGHLNMFGAILTEPCQPGSDLGILFMDSGGYLNMCGHGTIAAVTVAINNGLIAKKDKVFLDTPSGQVECQVTYENGKVKDVSFINVPAFLLKKDIRVHVEGAGEIHLDIAFGGSFFAIVDAGLLDLKLDIHEQDRITALGLAIREAVNSQVEVAHPDIPEINRVDLVEFSLQVGEGHYKNAVIFGDGQLDRSPCGTGTCAKLAALQLGPNEQIIQESIIGSTFKGTVIGHATVGSLNAIVPKITGSAWITGIHKFMLEGTDPYKEGFLLK